MEPGILAGSLVGRLLAYCDVELKRAFIWAQTQRSWVGSSELSSKPRSPQLNCHSNCLHRSKRGGFDCACAFVSFKHLSDDESNKNMFSLSSAMLQTRDYAKRHCVCVQLSCYVTSRAVSDQQLSEYTTMPVYPAPLCFYPHAVKIQPALSKTQKRRMLASALHREHKFLRLSDLE